MHPGNPRRNELTSKADFTDVYNAADPRGYYTSLRRLDYQVPAHAAPVFRRLAERLRRDGRPPTVLDVCCSYGVNAALLNHELRYEEICDHYADPRVAPLDREELVARDRAFFAERRRADAAEVLGLDISRRAVTYAVDVGLLDDGLIVDLEVEHPDADLDEVSRRLARVDLVIVTGGVSYVQGRTFERIVAARPHDPPWIAAFTLRWIGFDPIAEALATHGLVTERPDGYLVRQRRFADEDERRFVLESFDRSGVEPTALELDGWHCAELFVARPEPTARAAPIDGLLGDLVPQHHA